MLLPLGASLLTGVLGILGPPQGLSVLAHFFALAPIDFVFGVPVPLPCWAALFPPLGGWLLAIIAPFPEFVVEYGLPRYVTGTSYTVH